MPSFDDRNNDQTRDNLFGADAGPKAELGPAKQSGGGQGDNNNNKEQSLQDLQAPKNFTTSYQDFVKSIESARQKEQASGQQQVQTADQRQEHEIKPPPPPKQEQKQEHKH
jgi:hypothetical protein